MRVLLCLWLLLFTTSVYSTTNHEYMIINNNYYSRNATYDVHVSTSERNMKSSLISTLGFTEFRYPSYDSRILAMRRAERNRQIRQMKLEAERLWNGDILHRIIYTLDEVECSL
jgi:hypothetical protein